MTEKKKKLDQSNTISKIVSQSLGLTLTDEVIAEVLAGNAISLDQLSKNNNLTEVGTALIRLDGFSKILPSTNEVQGLRICVQTPLGEICANVNIPPKEEY